MGLKIEHICEKTLTLRGTLDGVLPVQGELSNGKIRIRIAGWVHEVCEDLLTGSAALRYAIYPAIAAYRNA